MSGRVIAVGDIHGCSKALSTLVDALELQSDDMLIGLGDYVDRGPDSRGVLDQLIALSRRCQLVPILGNHDQLMLRSRDGDEQFRDWMSSSGDVALSSYGSTGTLNQIPAEHFRFLEQCLSYFETRSHLFVHANYKPELPLDQTDDYTLRWLSLRVSVPGPHYSGKIAVMGHTPQNDVLDLGHLICLDTGCCYGRILTAMDMVSGQFWQAEE